MSRIGKMPVQIPAGVTVAVDNSTVIVKGPKGELTRTFSPLVSFKVEGDEVLVAPENETREANAQWGFLIFSLLFW